MRLCDRWSCANDPDKRSAERRRRRILTPAGLLDGAAALDTTEW
jgi:hypothetical protein